MNTATFAALEALAARGASLTMPAPGRLALSPPDLATADDLEALRPARSWLLQAWQAAAAHDAEHPPRPDVDPLPPLPGADDAGDAVAWGAALALCRRC
ncbi:MAG: hypothetical protein IPJ58_12210 [Ardenticatenia bacterium]|nr:hypothetical protein [Ardenticatenia bacterium]